MPEDIPSLLASCTPAPTLVRLEGAEIVRLIVQAKRTTEARLGDMHELIKQAEEEAVGARPKHTRFEDNLATDAEGDQAMGEVPKVEDDVLNEVLLGGIDDMVAPSSALFGSSVVPGVTKVEESLTPEAAKAKEIRATLVLAVAVPDHVLVGDDGEDMDVDENAVAAEEAAKPVPQPTGPVVISETYAKYKPEAQQQRQPTSKAPQADKNALDLPTISLGDIDDSEDAEDTEKDSAPAAKRARKSHSRKQNKQVDMASVQPFDYDTAETADVIGASTVTVEAGTKKAKRNAKSRDRKAAKGKGGFDPYSELAMSRDLAKRPNKTRINNSSGNRSMSFKK
ncbi:hypothetical protein FBU59_005445 [Linderina macrospora]|uniref:Uncharacterized protein n=1 Tax=Linderina macrospora TaxID=4868 RepID=A0ACC1J2J7_9FUNG|nr:hypothetical protein FBU59_005445 [Linderina macrospora]